MELPLVRWRPVDTEITWIVWRIRGSAGRGPGPSLPEVLVPPQGPRADSRVGGVAVNYVDPKDARLRGLWHRHFADPRRERAFLSAAGFNLAFLTCRVVTHSIRAEKGPFHNMSAGGRHLHHCTFGIFGLMGVGYVWTYQWALGTPETHRVP
jgi:hypothetical protein